MASQASQKTEDQIICRGINSHNSSPPYTRTLVNCCTSTNPLSLLGLLGAADEEEGGVGLFRPLAPLADAESSSEGGQGSCTSSPKTACTSVAGRCAARSCGTVAETHVIRAAA